MSFKHEPTLYGSLTEESVTHYNTSRKTVVNFLKDRTMLYFMAVSKGYFLLNMISLNVLAAESIPLVGECLLSL